MKTETMLSIAVAVALAFIGGCTSTQNQDIKWDYDSGWLKVDGKEIITVKHNLGGDAGRYDIHFLVESDLETRRKTRQHDTKDLNWTVSGLPDDVGINTFCNSTDLDVSFEKEGIERVRVQILVKDEKVG